MNVEEKSEDRINHTKEVESAQPTPIVSTVTIKHSIFASIKSWLSRHSVMHTLEQRLLDKDKEIEYLKSQVKRWEDRCIAFQDSMLLSKGMRSTNTVATNNNEQAQQVTTQTNKSLPGESLFIESELDRLKETMIYRPKELEEEINDLLAQPTPRNKMIVKRFTDYIESLPEEKTESGVLVIQ